MPTVTMRFARSRFLARVSWFGCRDVGVGEHPTHHSRLGVLAGARAVLIRGPAGSGKSRLALNLIQAASKNGPLIFARLVADDRVHVEAAHDRLIARPPAALAGLLEVRGLGIQRLPYEPVAVVSWVVDLAVPAPMRIPDDSTTHAVVCRSEDPTAGGRTRLRSCSNGACCRHIACS